MTWDEEFEIAQRELSVASRNDTWWKSLPEDRRAILGRTGYRAKCKAARSRMKFADERCRALIHSRKAAKKAEEAAQSRRTARAMEVVTTLAA